MIKGTYQGKFTLWHGENAMLQPTYKAQFANPGLHLGYGWHPFELSDFKVEEKKPLYVRLAEAIESGDYQRVNDLVKMYSPKGGGFVEDAGALAAFEGSTHLDGLESQGRLVFLTRFNTLAWISVYTVTVTPSLTRSINVRVTGQDRNGSRDFIAEVFRTCLMEEI